MTSRREYIVTAALAVCFGVLAASAMADPAAPQPAAPPTDPALQKQMDAFQTKWAAAVNGRSYADYKTTMDQFAMPTATFVNERGDTVTLAKYLDFMKQQLPTRSPGMTETISTDATTVTGDTALENGTQDDAADAVDNTGQFGSKGQTHHLEQKTSFRAHWAKDGGVWKIQTIAFTDIEAFVDGNPYIPPRPKSSGRQSNSRGKKR